MKQKIILGMALVFTFSFGKVQAQSYGTDSLTCSEKLSVFYEFYKAKNYGDAYKPWKWTFDNCPASSKNIYIIGPRLMKARIAANKDNPEVLQGLVDTLLMVWDARNQHFPGQESYIQGEKADIMMKYRKKESFEEAYGLLKTAVAAEGNEAGATDLFNYVKSSAMMYNDDKLDKFELIDVYQTTMRHIDYNLEFGEEKYMKYYEQARTGIDGMLGPLFECEDLIPLFEEAYDNFAGDELRLARAAKLLERKECTDSDIYFRIAAQMFSLNPDIQSGIAMGNMSMTREEWQKAVEYYQLAASRDTVANRRAETNLKIATAYQKLGQRASARTFALKAANDRTGWGDPFILIGDLYASTKGCGSTEFEVKTVYWAALDKYYYAKSIDPSAADKANKRISTYKEYAPDFTLAFNFGKHEDTSVPVGCWINETATVRFPDRD